MAATDPFSSNSTGLDSPGRNAVAVTPNDSTDLTVQPRGIYVGGAGDVVVQMLNASNAIADVTFVGVAAGSLLPIRPTRVKATSTTATNIVAVW